MQITARLQANPALLLIVQVKLLDRLIDSLLGDPISPRHGGTELVKLLLLQVFEHLGRTLLPEAEQQHSRTVNTRCKLGAWVIRRSCI
nr:hypothetical protein [Dongshaea marina]